jgi:single-strand DNA-binding protein
MSNYNKCIFIGRLTGAPEMKYLQNGTPVTKFTIAVDRQKKQDGTKECDFIPVVTWQKLAEVCAQYLEKGKPVLIDGRLQVRSYTDNDGNKRKAFEIVANTMQMLGSRGDSKPQAQDAPPSDDDNPSMADLGMDQEVPF